MKKRIAAFVFSVIMILGMTVSAETYEVGSSLFEYTVSESTAQINFYSGDSNVVIPDEIDGYTVTGISATAFRNNTEIESVTFPSSIKIITANSFSGCTSLKSIYIPRSVTTIGANAFNGCESLTEINYEGNEAQWIAAVHVLSGNDVISEATINYEAVSENEEDPDEEQDTDEEEDTEAVINYCGDNVTWELDEDGVLTIRGKGEMTNWTNIQEVPWYSVINNIKEVVIRARGDVISIGEYAFCACDNLTSVYIPKSIEYIASYAFNRATLDISYEGEDYEYWGIQVGNGNYGFRYANVTFNVAQAPDAFEIKNSCGENLEWELDENGILTIAGSGAMKTWKSAEEVPWDSKIDDITGVVIGDEVTSIGKYAFSNCTNLSTLEIGDAVESIEDYAFSHCEGLTELNLGKSVSVIGERAFEECNGITTVYVPGSVTKIENAAFIGCSAIQTVRYEYGETEWNDDIEWNDENGDLKDREKIYYCGRSGKCNEDDIYGECCWKVTKSGVLEIRCECAMGDWESEEDVAWYSLREEIVSVNGVTEKISDYAFSGCKNLTEIEIPEELKSVGKYAFSDCEKLSNINLQNEVETIGEGAFNGCKSLTGFAVPHLIESIPARAFDGCESLEEIELENAGDIGEGAFRGCRSLSGIELTGFTKNIGREAFAQCVNLSEAVIPESVVSIGEGAFSNCENITHLTIPQAVTEIGLHAFMYSGVAEFTVDADNLNYCSDGGNLFNKEKTTLIQYATGKEENSYTIPNTVKTIKSGAFGNADNLTGIIIPDSVETIGEYAFANCAELLEIIVPDSVTVLGEGAFTECAKLEDVVTGSGVTRINPHMFSGCSNLNSVKIGSSVTSIGDHAFSGSGITEIVVPTGVTEIEDEAFSECRSLENISLPDTLTAIYSRAFNNCESLVTITIPDSVTTIGEWAFSECRGMISAIVGDSVTYIPNGAFEMCESLTNVTFPHNLGLIEDGAFNACDNFRIAYFNGTREEWSAVEKRGYMPSIVRLICWVTFADNEGNILYKAKNLKTDDQGIAASIIPRGCYEALYCDKELTQEYKLDTPMTENITLYVSKDMAEGTKTLVSSEDEIVDNKTLFTIKGMKLEKGSRVILALYNNGCFMGFQDAVYRNGDVAFKTDVVYDKAKVMVWDDEKGFKPVFVAENIEK